MQRDTNPRTSCLPVRQWVNSQHAGRTSQNPVREGDGPGQEEVSGKKANSRKEDNRRIYEELEREKALKKMFIDQRDEARRELQAMKEHNKALLDAMNGGGVFCHQLEEDQLTTQEHKKTVAELSEVKQKYQAFLNVLNGGGIFCHKLEENQLMRQDYEKLEAEYKLSLESHAVQLSEEKERNKALLDEYEVSLKKVTTELIEEKDKVKTLLDQQYTDRASYQQLKEENEVIRQNYGRLQAEFKQSIEKNAAKLQDEMDKNKTLQEEMENMADVCLETIQRFEADIDDLKGELAKETKLKEAIQKDHVKLQEELNKVTLSYFDANEKYETEISIHQQQTGNLLSKIEEKAKVIDHLQQKCASLEGDQVSQVHFMVTIQSEKLRNKHLQEELQSIRGSYSQQTQQYETDVTFLREQTDHLQAELTQQVQSHTATMSDIQSLIHNLRAERDVLRQKVAEAEKKGEPVPDDLAVEPLEPTEVSEDQVPEQTKTPPSSLWKRTRHALGLRKPQSWKKK